MRATKSEFRGTPSLAGGRLNIDNLSIVYDGTTGPVTALDDLSMAVEDGQFIAVLGPSGCGKSTLLKVVSGLLKPTRGAVLLGEAPVKGPRPDVGLVFQHPNLLPWKTVRENILAPIAALRRDKTAYGPKADELLQLVGLADFSDNYPNELSGGMQQRVGIARGLIHDPSLLLMDEPFAALDAMTREHMTLELQSLWMNTDKSVLFITHSIPEAVFLADKVVVLTGRPGRVHTTMDIDIPRPRRIETMASKDFASYCTELRNIFG